MPRILQGHELPLVVVVPLLRPLPVLLRSIEEYALLGVPQEFLMELQEEILPTVEDVAMVRIEKEQAEEDKGTTGNQTNQRT